MKKYFLLHPAVFKLDGGAMFGIIPKPLWSKQILADELNRIELSLRLLLIQTSHRNILLDTGIGDYHGEKFDQRFGVKGPKQPLYQLLKSHFNLLPSDITDVIISHLHFDHVGGLGSFEGESFHSNFPQATLHLHQQHFDYALNPTIRDTGSFETQYFEKIIHDADQKGQVKWHSGEEGLLLNDEEIALSFKCSHGHTPWLMHAFDEKFIYMADLVPTLSHVPLAWVMGYDISPGQTTRDKESFYEFIAAKNLTMIFEHDPYVWGAQLEKKRSNPIVPKDRPVRFDVLKTFTCPDDSAPNSAKKVFEIFAD